MEAVLNHRSSILDCKMKYEQSRGRRASRRWSTVSDMVSDAYKVSWISEKRGDCQQRLDLDYRVSGITALERDPLF